MRDPARTLALRRELAAWSDGVQDEAAELAGGYRDLLAKRITNAQLSGLQNVVQAALSFHTIKRFVAHQGEKARRNNRYDVQDYWSTVGKALEGLRRPAEEIWTKVYDAAPSRQELNTWHCRLAQEFVQHLVAHSLWARPAYERDKRHSHGSKRK